MAKQVSIEHAVERINRWRSSGETLVLANGVFDLLHVGHVRYLAGARALGSRLVVGLNGDRSAAALKGPGRPVLGAQDRAHLVAALRDVDLVVIFDEPTADRLLERIQPDVHVKGTDYQVGTVPERSTVTAMGGRVEIAGDEKTHSSRELVSRVLSRYART
jgi:rfaE bifunctional protein nucleotidyltransferase chain/domain